MPIEQLRLDHDRRLVTILLVIMLVPILWFVGPDLVGLARHRAWFDVRVLTRLLLVAVPIAGVVLLRRAADAIRYSRIVLAVSLALGALMLGNNLQRPQGSILQMRVPFLYLIAMYGAMPNTLGRQVAAPLGYSAVVGALRVWWFGSYRPGDLSSDLLVLLCVNIVGVVMVVRRRRLESEVTASWRREHEARAQAEQVAKDLQTLQGIIKICSYCRKVHSETGVWQQIESYVRDRTGAEFSHGICPECLANQYPDGEPIEA